MVLELEDKHPMEGSDLGDNTIWGCAQRQYDELEKITKRKLEEWRRKDHFKLEYKFTGDRVPITQRGAPKKRPLDTISPEQQRNKRLKAAEARRG